MDACHKDPCQNITLAIASTCQPLGYTDFLCDCHTSSSWDEDINACTSMNILSWSKECNVS